MSRRAKAAAIALIASLALAGPAAADSVGVITGGLDGSARFGADLTAIDTPQHRVLWIGGSGGLQNLLDVLHTRGVDAGLMLSDTVRYAREHHAAPPAELAHIQYIATLWQDEVHVLARPDIKALPDLDGKKVNVDVVGSSSWMTADVVFRILGLHPVIETRPQDAAMLALRAGKLDAVLQVGGAPVALFADLPDDSALHFVPIPDLAGLEAVYAPSALTSAEYPHLLHEDIPTLSIGAVLAVYGWPVGSARYRTVAAFTRDLYEHFDAMAKPPRHPKWHEVNLAAAVPGWTRFLAADEQIKDRFFHDEEQKLPNLGAHPTPAQLDRLWRDYVLWRDAALGH